jgi:hypothetical protein
VAKYEHFLAMKPMQFAKSKDPFDADAWIRAIEAMLTAFTLPCSEEHKANFVALQLHGLALMWWEHYKSIQQPEHQITWDEFKKTSRDHHVPKALTDRKMRELLALKQGFDTVYQYAQKFKNLWQYAGYHVDTDAKKMECFRNCLDGELYERLNLEELDSCPTLVNKAISQEDAMKSANVERKRMVSFTSNNVQIWKLRIVQKTFLDPQLASQPGKFMAKQP